MDAREHDASRAEFKAICDELTEDKIKLLLQYALELVAEENGK